MLNKEVASGLRGASDGRTCSASELLHSGFEDNTVLNDYLRKQYNFHDIVNDEVPIYRKRLE